MYLLNREITTYYVVVLSKFTFHYVSIKSDDGVDEKTIIEEFTFHYVSIKSV